MNANVRDIDIIKTWCLKSTLNFTRYFFKENFGRKFVVGDHHKQIAQVLDDVLAGRKQKVIINIAPRYGKTEQAVKNFIAEGLGINPKAKFIHLSYSDDLARDNSKGVQDIMSLDEYKRIFQAQPTSPNSKKWYTEQGGGLYAVSSAGQVTGFGAGLVDNIDIGEDEIIDEFTPYCDIDEEFGGAIIIDDPIKPDDAMSSTIREKVNNKFETTIRNRVNSRKTPIIIIMQRLHENDLCGYLMKQEPGEWFVLSLPCIYEDENGNEKALWEFKHNLDELKKIRNNNKYVFETQYMQNPKPLEGLMYEHTFKTYEVIPFTSNAIRKNYTDTADEGKDYLCSINYIETEFANYVTDILYTQKPMEYTETKTAEMLTKGQIEKAVIESNNGGRGFARNVEKQCRAIGNNKTRVTWFFQGQNKNARIFTNSADVQNVTYFPVGWERMFPEFHKAITYYMKVGKNDHDDAPDALTGTVEQRPNKKGIQNLEGIF